jgi:hypothetical protein
VKVRAALRRLLRPPKPFNYITYWQERYQQNGDSGAGSYGLLADYKAAVINRYLREQAIQSVIEFGVGDGHQLTLIDYPSYLGLDVASSSIERCCQRFAHDQRKSFLLYRPSAFQNHGVLQADLVVCLDVLYHITDEADFRKTLADMVSCTARFLLLYTQLYPLGNQGLHIADRALVPYLRLFPELRITGLIAPRYPELSSASFIFLERFA